MDERDRKREKEELEEIRQRLLAEGHPDPDAELQRVSQSLCSTSYSCIYPIRGLVKSHLHKEIRTELRGRSVREMETFPSLATSTNSSRGTPRHSHDVPIHEPSPY